jgi:hypothetical protein
MPCCCCGGGSLERLRFCAAPLAPAAAAAGDAAVAAAVLLRLPRPFFAYSSMQCKAVYDHCKPATPSQQWQFTGCRNHFQHSKAWAH